LDSIRRWYMIWSGREKPVSREAPYVRSAIPGE
jgi:hypothetical protein